MGLATIDPQSQNVQTKLYKIHKFGVNRPKRKHDTAVWKFQNLQKIHGHPDAVRHSVRMAIHFFVNFDIFKWLYLAYFWVYLHQTCGFCKAWSAFYDCVDH